MANYKHRQIYTTANVSHFAAGLRAPGLTEHPSSSIGKYKTSLLEIFAEAKNTYT